MGILCHDSCVLFIQKRKSGLLMKGFFPNTDQCQHKNIKGSNKPRGLHEALISAVGEGFLHISIGICGVFCYVAPGFCDRPRQSRPSCHIQYLAKTSKEYHSKYVTSTQTDLHKYIHIKPSEYTYCIHTTIQRCHLNSKLQTYMYTD